MNSYKIRYILEFIRSKGRLPRDPMGNMLGLDDLLAWYGVAGRLTVLEEQQLKRELVAMVEAELFMERLRLEAG